MILSFANFLAGTFTAGMVFVFLRRFPQYAHGMNIVLILGALIAFSLGTGYLMSALGFYDQFLLTLHARPQVLLLILFPGIVAASQYIRADRKERKAREQQKGGGKEKT